MMAKPLRFAGPVGAVFAQLQLGRTVAEVQILREFLELRRRQAFRSVRELPERLLAVGEISQFLFFRTSPFRLLGRLLCAPTFFPPQVRLPAGPGCRSLSLLTR